MDSSSRLSKNKKAIRKKEVDIWLIRNFKTNADGTVHGSRHNSVLLEGDNYYIVYHRHDNPHSNHGFHCQVAIDKLEFNADGTIKEVVPIHEGLNLKPEITKHSSMSISSRHRMMASTGRPSPTAAEESIYINDKLISQKDIQLLVKPSQFMLLGKNAEEAWPFSGYLHSLKLWDEYIPYKKQTK